MDKTVENDINNNEQEKTNLTKSQFLLTKIIMTNDKLIDQNNEIIKLLSFISTNIMSLTSKTGDIDTKLLRVMQGSINQINRQQQEEKVISKGDGTSQTMKVVGTGIDMASLQQPQSLGIDNSAEARMYLPKQ